MTARGARVDQAVWLVAASLAASVACGGEGRREIAQSMMPYTITQPGSYVLTENLAGVTGSNGVMIASDHVTLDLNGFQLIGVAGTLHGITTDGLRVNVSVRNGTVRNWGGTGVKLDGVTNALVREVRSARNGGDGVRVGPASQVTDCSLFENGGDGVNAARACIVAQCVARENGGDGIESGPGALVRHCVLRENGDNGVLVGEGSNVIGCTTRSNSDDGIVAGTGSRIGASVGYSNDVGLKIAGSGGAIMNSTAFGNLLQGIDGGDGSSVIGCSVAGNTGGGITVGQASLVARNAIYDSGTVAADGGIITTGDNNRLEENHTVDCATGFVIGGTDNLVVRNSSSGSDFSAEYDIEAGNLAEIHTGDPDTAGPWENFDY